MLKLFSHLTSKHMCSSCIYSELLQYNYWSRTLGFLWVKYSCEYQTDASQHGPIFRASFLQFLGSHKVADISAFYSCLWRSCSVPCTYLSYFTVTFLQHLHHNPKEKGLWAERYYPTAQLGASRWKVCWRTSGKKNNYFIILFLCLACGCTKHGMYQSLTLLTAFFKRNVSALSIHYFQHLY